MTLIQITKVKGPGIHTLANIVSNTISLGGIATASNFKTGTSNLHSAGVEVAGVNVLGADTPIGTGATIYDAGGAVFTGVVTATSFSGSVSGTADLASGLTGTPDVAVRNITGVGATFTGNVSIGGTLTYEDVTNIDSVGIVTAREGIFLPDNKKLQLGNAAGSADLKLYHQSSDNHSYFTNSTGDLNIQGDVIRLKKADGGKTMAAFHQGGSQDFYYDTTRRLYTTTTGAALDYKLTIGGAAGSPGIISLVEGGAVSEIRVTRNSDANSDLQFKTERGDGTQVRAKINYSGDFVVPSNKVGIGTDDPGRALTIRHSEPRIRLIDDDTGSFSEVYTDNTGHLYLSADAGQSNGGSRIVFNVDGGEKVRINNTGNVGIGTDNPDTVLHLMSTNPIIKLTDQNQAADNKNWIISGGNTQLLRIQALNDAGGGGGSLFDFYRSGNNINEFRGMKAGNTWFVVDNLNKEVGIGTDTPSGNLHVQTTGGTYDPLVLERKGSANWGIKPYANTLYFRSNSDGSDSFNSRDRFSIGWDGTDARGGDVNFYGTAAGVTSCTWDASANRFHMYDDVKLSFGAANDLDIYHTTSGTSWIRHGNTSEYFVIEGNQMDFRSYTNSHYRVRMGTAVELRHNNIERLKTSSTGVTVTGEVATSQDYPNYRPTLDLNFAAVKKLDPRIVYYRTGPASYVDEFGKVVLVGDNTPRFDHDSATKESKGLLIEESRTNDWAYSTDLSKVTSQGGFAGTQTFNTTTAPDGTTTADSHKGSGSSGRHSLYWEPQLYSSAQLDNSSVYTFSVFVKQITGNSAERYCELETAQHSTWTNAGGSPTFDLQNGTMNTSNASSNITGTIESYPDGWYRISMTSTTGTTNNDTGFYFNHTASDGSSTQTLATTEGFYFWGAQIEKGSFITSYIPTSGATVNRGVDFAVIDGTEFTDFYNQSEGTLLSEFTVNDTTTLTSGAIVNINALSTNTYADSVMFMEIGTTSGYYGRVYKSSNGYSLTGNGNITTNGLMGGNMSNKVSFAWCDSTVDEGLAAYRNGVLQNSSASEDRTPTNMTELRIGRGWSSSHINAHIKRLSYYPKRLPNSQLATLTA